MKFWFHYLTYTNEILALTPKLNQRLNSSFHSLQDVWINSRGHPETFIDTHQTEAWLHPGSVQSNLHGEGTPYVHHYHRIESISRQRRLYHTRYVIYTSTSTSQYCILIDLYMVDQGNRVKGDIRIWILGIQFIAQLK